MTLIVKTPRPDSLEDEDLGFDETLDLDNFEVIANSSIVNHNNGLGDTFNISTSEVDDLRVKILRIEH